MNAASISTNSSEIHSMTFNADGKWEGSIKQRLKAYANKQGNPKSFTICRVPDHVRCNKDVYYEPSFVSIGPYHYGKKELEVMEDHKWRYLNDFLLRNPNNNLMTYMKRLSKLELRARRCYFEDITMESKEFIEMLLLDGCFIIEFLLQYYNFSGGCQTTAGIRRVGWFLNQIREDLILMENQIPFFVILNLFDLVMTCEINSTRVDIVELAARFLSEPYQTEFFVGLIGRNEIDHLLHLYHHCTVNMPESQESKNMSFFHPVKKVRLNPLRLLTCCMDFWQMIKYRHVEDDVALSTIIIPCATKLVDAGIKFKKKNTNSFLDITFSNGVLEIPLVLIGNAKRCRLMNLVAFEQFNFRDMFVSNYVQFMHFIIDTPNDVQMLKQCGIIVSYLESNEKTAQFFSELRDYVSINDDEHFLTPLYLRVSEFYYSNWHQSRASLMREFFGNLRAIPSLLAAVALLILVRNFFAACVYFHPTAFNH